MAYNIVTTYEMDMLLENSIKYILNKLKNEQAASHLLNEVQDIYNKLENNPAIYSISSDPFLAVLDYHEAVLKSMNYKIIYKYDDSTVYILGIYNNLENYVEKVRQIWDNLNINL